MLLGLSPHELSSDRSIRLAMTGKGGADVLHGKAIALVDDDEAVRDAIQGLLEVLDVEVRAYQSGIDFLQDGPKVACLILDYNMPDLNGFDVISELRKRGVELPTIASGADEISRGRTAWVERYHSRAVSRPIDGLARGVRGRESGTRMPE